MPYLAGLLSASTTFAAIKYWIFPEYGFAIYLIIVDACLIFSIYGRRILTKGFLFTRENRV
jgi:hypothetical protein